MFTDKNQIKCPMRKNVILQVIMTNTLILEIDTNLPNYDRDSKIIRGKFSRVEKNGHRVSRMTGPLCPGKPIRAVRFGL